MENAKIAEVIKKFDAVDADDTMPPKVARALYDEAKLSTAEIAYVLHAEFSSSFASAARTLHSAGLPAAEVASALFNHLHADDVASVLFNKDGLDLPAAEIARILKDGLGLSIEKVAGALYKGCSTLPITEVARALKDGLALSDDEADQALCENGLYLDIASPALRMRA